MPEKFIKTILFCGLCLLALAACATLKSTYPVPASHPEDVGEGRPTCTDCHESSDDHFNYRRFNHSPLFAEQHSKLAYQSEAVCSMCHATSFCNDCHATRVELKPSIKNQTENYRRMPHRGDFLTRHRFEARLDPTSCFRCHGNPKTATSCAPCHG